MKLSRETRGDIWAVVIAIVDSWITIGIVAWFVPGFYQPLWIMVFTPIPGTLGMLLGIRWRRQHSHDTDKSSKAEIPDSTNGKQ